MKATEARLLDYLKKSPQFEIPIYQRTYSWTERECRQLWDDIVRTGKNADVAAHFVGSIVYVEKGLYSVSSQSALLVIDGQQRLTTVMLLLEALARAVGEAEPFDGFSARKIRNYYLLNPEEKDEHGLGSGLSFVIYGSPQGDFQPSTQHRLTAPMPLTLSSHTRRSPTANPQKRTDLVACSARKPSQRVGQQSPLPGFLP